MNWYVQTSNSREIDFTVQVVLRVLVIGRKRERCTEQQGLRCGICRLPYIYPGRCAYLES